MKYSEKMNSLKKGEGDTTFKFWRRSWGSTFKLWGRSQGPEVPDPAVLVSLLHHALFFNLLFIFCLSVSFNSIFHLTNFHEERINNWSEETKKYRRKSKNSFIKIQSIGKNGFSQSELTFLSRLGGLKRLHENFVPAKGDRGSTKERSCFAGMKLFTHDRII